VSYANKENKNMRTKPTYQETAEECAHGCYTVDEHRERLQQHEEKVVKVMANLAMISLTKTGGIHRAQATVERSPRPTYVKVW
jgi:hypothetical protein